MDILSMTIIKNELETLYMCELIVNSSRKDDIHTHAHIISFEDTLNIMGLSISAYKSLSDINKVIMINTVIKPKIQGGYKITQDKYLCMKNELNQVNNKLTETTIKQFKKDKKQMINKINKLDSYINQLENKLITIEQ